MGLLDDAIREHLDLKRQRGADPAEIERMEREALGPVRREPTLGSSHFELLDEHAPRALEHEYPEEHLTELEELQELGYNDSTAPHPHPHHEHDHPHHEQAEHYADFDAEHALEPLTEHMQVPQEETEQPRRRFLRRSRPSSLSEPGSPEPVFHEQAPPRPEGLRGHDDLDEAELAVPPAPEPAAPHVPAPQAPAPQPAAQHPGSEQRPEPPPTSAEPPAAQSGPPHLRFEHPPKRPRFTAEPPLQPDGEGEPASAGEAPPPAPASPPPAPAPPPHPEPQETTEFDVQQHLEQPPAPAGQPADEDVLEETPEFLQDTPEHDRLWFEQRPPRDFDFDG